MTSPDTLFLRACGTKGLILDTNILIILLVGSYNPAFIPKCKKTSAYTGDDYVYIRRILEQTRATIIVTPHILSEVSNLTFRDSMIKEPGFSEYIKKLIDTITLAEESHTEKSLLLSDAKLLARFGFADLSILEAAKKLGCAVLTNESALFGLLSNLNYPVWDIDFVRAAATTP